MQKSLVIAIVVLMMSALGAGVVGAQEPGGPQFGNRGPRDGGIMEVISEATGLTVQELHDALQADGATLASVIEASGGDVAAVRAELIANTTARVDEQSANLEARIDDLLNGEFAANRGGRGPGGLGGDGLENLAELLGVDADAVRESLQNGQTIAEIAAANGVDLQTVIGALVSAAEGRIDDAVEAGRLSAEDGEARKAELSQHISDRVNNVIEGRPGFGGRNGGPGGRGGNGGPGGNNDTAPQQDS